LFCRYSYPVWLRRNSLAGASEETILKSLVGDYREQYLFAFQQSLKCCRHYQEQIQELDLRAKQMLLQLPSKVAQGDNRQKGTSHEESLGEMNRSNYATIYTWRLA
jgi:hypothetical protein